MSEHYPLKYNLEDGIQVVVNKTGTDLYDFALVHTNGTESHFSLTDDARPRDEKTADLTLDQLNAVRAFWLTLE